ncbi:MAG: flippase-like domain-containing protein [Anaerolineales bacterium]|nr:flippase-like domain-containing protein [Anaerolineales bacterium]
MNIMAKLRWFILDKSISARRARQRVKIGFLVILFAALFWVIPIHRVVQAMIGASLPLLLLGIIIQIPSTYLNALELKLIIKNQGLTLSVLQVWVINLVIKFYTLFMQGTLAATGIRWYKFSQKDNKPAEALASVAFYRLLETFLSIAMGLAFWALNSNKPFQLNALLLISVLIAITVFWVAITRLSKPVLTWIKRQFASTIEKPGWKTLYAFTEKILLAIAAFSSFSGWQLFLVIVVAISQQLVSAVSNYYFALSIGITLPLKDIIWISSVVVLLTQLPIAVAGGFGVREASLVALMATFGIRGEQALAYSFLLFLRGVLISLSGGLLDLIQTLMDKPSVKVEENVE